MIDRINHYVTARFAGVGTTRGSFIRIHAWAIAFLIIVSTLAGHGTRFTARRYSSRVDVVSRAYGDQRGFGPSSFAKKRYFHIAWIAGSEADVFGTSKFDLVPSLVQSALPTIDGRPVVIDVYYLPSMRLGDAYFALLDAVASKPDMLVMSLNPVWVLNPIAVHQWSQLDARAALALAGRPKEWPLAAALTSPSDLAWGFAGSRLKVVKERVYWSDRIQRLVKDLGPLDRTTLAKETAARKPDRALRVLNELPVEFWFQYRLHLPRVRENAVNGDAMGPHRWAQWIDQSNTNDHPINSTLLRAVARELAASHIPSYVYLGQVNTSWLKTDPAVRSAVTGIEHQLAGFRNAFSARNVRYEPKTLSRFVPGIRFLAGDVVHLTDAPGLGPYLAAELCRVEAQVGHGAGCVATAQGTAP